MPTVVDQYLKICWQKAFGESSGQDFIYVNEIFALIRELEDFIGSPGKLFNKNEISILQKMADKRPQLRLKILEAEKFLLQLVGFDTMENFLTARARTDIGALRRLVNNYPRGGPYKRSRPSTAIPIRNRSPESGLSARRTRYSYRDLLSDPLQVPFRVPLKDPLREDAPTKSSSTLPGNLGSLSGNPGSLSGHPGRLSGVPEDESSWFGNWWKVGSKSKVKESERKYDIPDEIEPIRPFVKKEFANTPVDLRNTSTQFPGANDTRQQDRIRELELLCRKYESELAQRRSSEAVEKLTKKLKDTLYEQDKVIHELRNQVDCGADPNFLWRLPGIKQYLRYQSPDQRTYGVLIVESLALMLMFVLLANILKLIYYTKLTLETKKSSFYSDDDSISFSWIQQIPWIEYKLYQLQDWLDGA